MKTVFPPALKIGDTIGVMAPSSRIAHEHMDAAKSLLENKGYKVFIHPQVLKYSGNENKTQYAGSVIEKLNAFHDLVRDPKIRAIFFATGGQRCATILDGIDFDLVRNNPKTYMGFSDLTSLLNKITAHTKIPTWHGPNAKTLLRNPQADFNFRLLHGEEKSIPLNDAKILSDGAATGIMIGGNLAAFCAMHKSDCPDPNGAILFLEEVSEELTAIDRNLLSLKRGGLFKKLGGIIFGQFTDMKDTGTPFGFTLEDIIREHTDGLNIPVLMNAPFGHDNDLPSFPIGANVRLEKNMLTIL